jgi:hypothetical protein
MQERRTMNVRRTSQNAAVILASLLCLMQVAPALAGSPPPHAQGGRDHPHHARHYQAGPRYVMVDQLPRGCRHVVHRGRPYYYYGANWYQPYGVRFVVVAPPAGIVIDGRGITLAAQVPVVRW